MSKKYKVKVRCRNCKLGVELEIKKGVEVHEVMEETKCKKCGCFLALKSKQFNGMERIDPLKELEEIEKTILDIDIEAVKIIGNFYASGEEIELEMDKKMFYEFLNKQKEKKK